VGTVLAAGELGEEGTLYFFIFFSSLVLGALIGRKWDIFLGRGVVLLSGVLVAVGGSYHYFVKSFSFGALVINCEVRCHL
jgi:hypothetical protein